MGRLKKLSRRRFILISMAAFVGALFATFYFFDFDTVVFKIIKKDLAYLKISDRQIEKFIKEANSEQHWIRKFFNWEKQSFMRISFMLEGFWKGFPYYYKYSQYKSEIVGDFLLSTDFFINKMDQRKEINYITLYNPYKRACSNPFSNLYYPLG